MSEDFGEIHPRVSIACPSSISCFAHTGDQVNRPVQDEAQEAPGRVLDCFLIQPLSAPRPAQALRAPTLWLQATRDVYVVKEGFHLCCS